MNEIPYTIRIPKRALLLLANIYSPTEEDLRVNNKIFSTLDEFMEKPWNRTAKEYKKFLKEEGEEEPEMITTIIEWHKGHEKSRQKKIKSIRKNGFYYERVFPFIFKATEIKDLRYIGNNEIFTRDQINSILGNYLYGLVGAVQHQTNSKRRYTEKLYASPFIYKEIQSCFDKELGEDGSVIFESTINSSSIDVLKFFLDKTENLKNNYGSGWFPLTHPSEIQREIGISKAKAEAAAKDLVGIISEVVTPKGFGDYKYTRTFFLPTSRYELAKEIIGTH